MNKVLFIIIISFMCLGTSYARNHKDAQEYKKVLEHRKMHELSQEGTKDNAQGEKEEAKKISKVQKRKDIKKKKKVKK